MPEARIGHALAVARELEERDRTLAEEVERLDEIQEAASSIRSRAAAIDRFLAQLPVERERRERARREAELEHETAKRRAGEAAGELTSALERADEHAAQLARRRLAEARASVTARERELAETTEAKGALEREAEGVARELALLEEHARDAASRLARARPRSSRPLPATSSGPRAVASWAAQVHGSVFVARNAVERERQALIRQANETVAGVLGEPLFATSVSLVRRRLEQELG